MSTDIPIQSIADIKAAIRSRKEPWADAAATLIDNLLTHGDTLDNHSVSSTDKNTTPRPLFEKKGVV